MSWTADWFKGKRIAVMGLGLFGGGLGVTRFLSAHGARVTVTDLRKPAELKESLSALKGIKNIRYALGGHRNADFIKADMVVVNPAVPEDSPFLKLARQHNVFLDIELGIFFKLCPCQIIGITGTNGKTTTATLIAEFLKGTRRKIWLGGNVGKISLLEHIGEIKSDDLVVLEISSFQLLYLNQTLPNLLVSVVTNIQPNHLDRHKDMAEYIGAKKNIINGQSLFSYAVLNREDDEVKAWKTKGAPLYFSLKPYNDSYTFIKGGYFCIRQDDKICKVGRISEMKLMGQFNQSNIAAALAVAGIFGVKPELLRQVIRTFAGVEHRLEFVTEKNGVKYYNDSIATNPVSTIGALRAMPGKIHLIAGGYDKKLPFKDMAKAIVQRRVKTLILLGATAGQIARDVKAARSGQKLPVIIIAKDFRDAVNIGRKSAKPGGIVLLSPACASFDMFRNFAERGDLFKKLVMAIK
ncbi:MAG: UDP-N-acetylmuramoyl-L-alanine--D-glutamate ligase [Planctomycetota bacterium]